MSIVRRASKSHRCPICDIDHSYSITDNGWFFCWRVHWEIPGFVYLGDCQNGCGKFRSLEPSTNDEMLRKQEGPAANVNGNGVHKKKTKPIPPVDWVAYLNRHRVNEDEANWMADMLNVNVDSLYRLQMGYVPESEDEPQHWLFP